jgi:predicted nuclease with TOPRIM domain
LYLIEWYCTGRPIKTIERYDDVSMTKSQSARKRQRCAVSISAAQAVTEPEENPVFQQLKDQLQQLKNDFQQLQFQLQQVHNDFTNQLQMVNSDNEQLRDELVRVRTENRQLKKQQE